MMIKLFLCDCDGTLTDGMYHTTENGGISKSFYTRDFHGLWMLHESGVNVVIITAAGDDVIVQQCYRGAKYADVIKRSKDKYSDIRKRYVDGGIGLDWDEICYIGDDVFDMELLDAVGVAACPIDANISVLNMIRERSDGMVSMFSGGHGCVREFADYVFDINKIGDHKCTL